MTSPPDRSLPVRRTSLPPAAVVSWSHLGLTQKLTPNQEKKPLSDQSLNGRLFQIVDELVRRGVTLEQARKEFKRQFIVASLKSNQGNLCRSARSLGVHRNTLRNKVSDLGIGAEDYDLPRRQRRRPPLS